MNSQEKEPHVIIKVADDENFIDLNLCAKEFLEFIKNFRDKFLNKKFFILTAYYDNVLAGLLVAEDKSQKVNSLTKVLPCMYLKLLYVNPRFRNRHLGKMLLDHLIEIQKERGIALISIKLPQRYKKGIQFFLKNNFNTTFKDNGRIILELNLWNDFGIRDCHIIDENFVNYE
ncbi:MAG: GNAT family N-acetyltransferase [Promethearchaeota archaeon]